MSSSSARSGRSVAVIGGTKGIGAALVQSFLEQGDRVLRTGRALKTGSWSNGAQNLRLDLNSDDAPSVFAQGCQDFLGGLDILCLNAGVFPDCPLTEITRDDLEAVMNINTITPMLVLIACIPLLKTSTCGRVILTSSITGICTGFPGWAHYGASKAAQVGFMRTAALELAPWGITMNAICPGTVLTEGLREKGEEYLDGIRHAIPLGRLALPKDVAATACFLASPDASYITGQIIVVDGGQTLPEGPGGVLPLVG